MTSPNDPPKVSTALGVAAAVYVGYALFGFVPGLADVRGLALVAAFYFVPGYLLRNDPERARRYQVGPDSPIPPWDGRAARVALLAGAVVFPPFCAAFVWFYGQVCGGNTWLVDPLVALEAHLPTAGALEAFLGELCRRYEPFDGFRIVLPESFRAYGYLGTVYAVAVEIFVVALPEEVFHRGFLMSVLEERFPPRHRILGVPFGLAAVASSAVFAVGHLVGMAQVGRLATFFPGLLFAWLWKKTGSLWAGTLFHAASNLLMSVLLSTTFPAG
ncbi:MAG: CPBP family intramembrane metalloprotease [Deltaproteobacteria bacterium]|nr:MAG: CPBP family intramembrane metalloprotease [Deltaproteobacteria bacterium]